MFGHYAEQGLFTGRTVEYEVTELINADGTHPLLHVEHIGEANASFVEESIARASAKVDQPEGFQDETRTNRGVVGKHGVRRMERVLRDDATPAADADIPSFVAALPAKAFYRLLMFVSDERHFYKQTISEKPAVLAEK